MSPNQPQACLFAYGTLMFPRIFAGVCGHGTSLRPATLVDYACKRVRGEVFPAIVACAGALTQGQLTAPLTAADWRRLDVFESDFYDRTTVRVTLTDGTSTAADVYVVAPRNRHLLDRTDWSATEFAERHHDRYLGQFASCG